MGTTKNCYSVHVYAHGDGTVTVNVVVSTYPSQGHWRNTYATILRGERLAPLRAEEVLHAALAEAIERALHEESTRAAR